MRIAILLTIGLVIISCAKPPKPKPKLPEGVYEARAKPELPEGWYEVKAGKFFIFYLPKNMKLRVPGGSPESEWGSSYSNDEMTLSAEYSSWGGEVAPDYAARQVEYKKEVTIIDGRIAKIQSWRLEDANWGHDYKYTAGLILYDAISGEKRAQMHLLSKQGNGIEIANQIFKSIQFQ